MSPRQGYGVGKLDLLPGGRITSYSMNLTQGGAGVKHLLLAIGMIFLISGCGYRFVEGDKHAEDPFFPGLGGDTGIVIVRQVLAGEFCLQLRLLDPEIVEAISLKRGVKRDTSAVIYIQRLDLQGRELSRTTQIIKGISSYEIGGCLQCSDESQHLAGRRGVMINASMPNAGYSITPVKHFEVTWEWITRTFGRDRESMYDSVRRIGERLDGSAGNYVLKPKTDSVLAWLDSLIYHRAYREAGMKSYHRLEIGNSVQKVGFDSLRKPVYLGDLGWGDPTLRYSVRCSSLVKYSDPKSPLWAWDSSVMENTSSGNHFVFGFNPKRMTYHRMRFGNREARFKLYGYSKLGPQHVRMSIVGGLVHRSGYWIAAGRAEGVATDAQRDTVYRIQLQEGLTGGAPMGGATGWLNKLGRKVLPSSLWQ